MKPSGHRNVSPGTNFAFDWISTLSSFHDQIVDHVRPGSPPPPGLCQRSVPIRGHEVQRLSLGGQREGRGVREPLSQHDPPWGDFPARSVWTVAVRSPVLRGRSLQVCMRREVWEEGSDGRESLQAGHALVLAGGSEGGVVKCLDSQPGTVRRALQFTWLCHLALLLSYSQCSV